MYIFGLQHVSSQVKKNKKNDLPSPLNCSVMSNLIFFFFNVRVTPYFACRTPMSLLVLSSLRISTLLFLNPCIWMANTYIKRIHPEVLVNSINFQWEGKTNIFPHNFSVFCLHEWSVPRNTNALWIGCMYMKMQVSLCVYVYVQMHMQKDAVI